MLGAWKVKWRNVRCYEFPCFRQNHHSYYQSSLISSQQRSCLVWFEPVEWDWVWFRRKRNLYSLIREWRGASWCPPVPGLLPGLWVGLLYRVLGSRDRWCSLKIVVQLCCLRLQIGVPSRHCVSSNPHKAHCRHLEEWHPVQTSAHSTKLRTPCSH